MPTPNCFNHTRVPALAAGAILMCLATALAAANDADKADGKNDMQKKTNPTDKTATSTPAPLAQYTGRISNKLPGWQFLAEEKGKMVQVPFEGLYESKGGRLQSPVIALDKAPGKGAFYRLTFKAKTSGHCYWWVDLFDAEGKWIPDINSAVYPGNLEDYDVMFYAQGPAVSIQLAFLSQAGVEVHDVTVRRATAAEGADWCDRQMAALPPLNFTPTSAGGDLLPKTAAALRQGRPWRIVMLGDSIMNDSFNSLFQSLVKRDFPRSECEFILSVRGSTGCWFYHEPENFTNYVARHKPDLLMIGGISNVRGADTMDADMQAVESVIRQAQSLGCEVAVLSPPMAVDWRQRDAGGQVLPNQNWRELSATTNSPNGLRLRYELYARAAQAHGAAFWDITTPTADYLVASGKPFEYFNRDFVHNNDRGKQVIGRVMQAYFRRAFGQ
ncbi:MAG: hypothetical protein PHR35_02295 [Kiritimatiellae bacterium]|nr:hypothetical protein [Kiritimatiellia bacterium]